MSRVALVTGGSRGIGAETARLLAARGMRVVVNYRRSQEEAEEVVASIRAGGGQALAVGADAGHAPDVQRMVEEVRSRWGGVDVLVHNVLVPFVMKSFREITWEELGQKLEEEMRAAFTVTKAVLPEMSERGYGRIIYLGTGLSRRPREGTIAVGTAKAALEGFARYVAQEVGPQGITVNVVAPGTVDTRTAEVIPEEQKARLAAAAPLGRIAQPEDVAGVIAFFASDDSGFMTGTYAPVNGGLAMD